MALAFGCTVAELENKIGSAELSEWMVYDKMYPIGDDRGDLQAGIISSSIFNALVRKKDGTQYSPIDFMPLQKPTPNPAKLLRAKLAHLVKK